MQELELKAKKRPTGKQKSKQIRNSGLIPGIYYFKGSENIPIVVDPSDIRPFVYTSKSKMISLSIEGDSTKRECVLKDVTFDPLTDAITHFDLVGLDKSHKMTFEVPIELKGQAIGVRMGCLLQHNLRKVVIQCLPMYMPSSFIVDISNLDQGKHIQLKDIKLENVDFVLPLDTAVVSVTASRVSAKA